MSSYFTESSEPQTDATDGILVNTPKNQISSADLFSTQDQDLSGSHSGVRFAQKEDNETFSVPRKQNSLPLFTFDKTETPQTLTEVPSTQPPTYPDATFALIVEPPVPFHSPINSSPEHADVVKAAPENDSSETGSVHMPLDKAPRELGRSAGTGSSFNSSHPNAVEVSETFKTKFFAMRWSWIAVVFNVLLLWLVVALSEGFQVSFTPESATILGCVVLELILIFSNAVTNTALDHGAAAYFGHRLSSRAGYSLAVCGYMQSSSIIDKMYFPSFLSLNSTCRQLLSRLSSAWLLLHALLILTPIAATSSHAFPIRAHDGVLPCIIFHDQGLITDRGFPNVTVQMGLAEMVFGTALGTPRSEFDVPETLFLITPQIVGAANDGDTVVGPGYSINVSTACVCAPSSDAAGLRLAGVPDAIIDPLEKGMHKLGHQMGLANHLTLNDATNRTHQSIKIVTALTGTLVCGGHNYENPDVPICFTTIHDFHRENVLVSYMTDGTPASIAPKAAHITELSTDEEHEYGGLFKRYPPVGTYGDLKNVATALNAVLDAQNSSSAFELPSNVPALVNPLLYWLTPNLMNVDPTLLEAGIETTFAIFLRAGVQRAFTTQGQSCIHNIEVHGVAKIKLGDYGVKVALVFVIVQLIISLVTIAAFVPWLMNEAPIGPAIRLMSDSVYFTTLLHASTLYNANTLCNAQPYVIWQAMDIVVRVGETFRSRDEEVVGHITIDRPKYIAALTNGRRYN